ncbi:hypothetical protein N9242_00730 [Vicingaceae bacterium]|jgi:hypothetical protein|nr:hypothetical protein [Vicingaceae bacterium]
MTDTNQLSSRAPESSFKNFNYPITFEFKIGTLANDFTAKDASGNTISYVKQKMFKLKEAINVFSNESQSETLYTIAADRVIDFNASYAFKNARGIELGKVGRKGRKSLLKAHYEIFSKGNTLDYTISEENPWAKVGDAVLGEIPVVGMFTGYLFNPKYIVKDNNDEIIARLSKEASFFGRRFKLEEVGKFKEGDDERIMLSLMMMSLLERRRG